MMMISGLLPGYSEHWRYLKQNNSEISGLFWMVNMPERQAGGVGDRWPGIVLWKLREKMSRVLDALSPAKTLGQISALLVLHLWYQGIGPGDLFKVRCSRLI